MILASSETVNNNNVFSPLEWGVFLSGTVVQSGKLLIMIIAKIEKKINKLVKSEPWAPLKLVTAVVKIADRFRLQKRIKNYRATINAVFLTRVHPLH